MIWKTSDGGHLLWSLFILGNINSISSPYPAEAKSFNLLSKTSKIKASLKRNEFPLISKRSTKTPRRLITISTSDGRWHGEWKRDYLFSLQDLQLEDLAEDGHRDAEVSITLFIHKHTGFGLSVDGRIVASFTRKCGNCSSPYNREVIYVRPGYEAELDSLIQDTIRLTTSVKETCSDTCENSEPGLQHLGRQNAASVNRRWSRLLELRNAHP
ncbi:unnamed protein product [Ilex paraguariensis]|uniref:Uncharacterized protein n=1 Tax=Ilex paraguariensis TaxID=185542 RepID=A0ABC8RF99_9AQUA